MLSTFYFAMKTAFQKGISMKEYVNVKKLLEEVDAMEKRGTLLARGEVTQEDLAIQLKGIIVHISMKE